MKSEFSNKNNTCHRTAPDGVIIHLLFPISEISSFVGDVKDLHFTHYSVTNNICVCSEITSSVLRYVLIHFLITK